MDSIDKQKYSYRSVTSTRGNSFLNNLDGSVVFETTLGSDERIDNLQNSYFMLNATVSSNLAMSHINDALSESVFNANTNQGISQNPAAAFITSAEATFNDKNIQRIENFETHSLIIKLLSESKESQKESLSPLIMYDDDFDRILTGVPPYHQTNDFDDIVLTKNFIAQMDINNNVIRSYGPGPVFTKFRKSTTSVTSPFTIQIGIPYPFMEPINQDENTLIYGNSKLSVAWQIRQNFNEYLFQGVSIAKNLIRIDNFEWIIPVYIDSIPQSIEPKYTFMETTTSRQIHNNTSYSVNMKSMTRRVIINFFNIFNVENDILAVTGAKNFGIPVNPDIKSIQISFGSTSYPSGLSYNLSLDDGSNSWTRAYNDYKMYSGSLPSGETNIISSLKEFIKSPVFIFNTMTAQNSIGSTICTINVTHNNAMVTNKYDIAITSMHYKELTLRYNEMGVPVDTPLLAYV